MDLTPASAGPLEAGWYGDDVLGGDTCRLAKVSKLPPKLWAIIRFSFLRETEL